MIWVLSVCFPITSVYVCLRGMLTTSRCLELILSVGFAFGIYSFWIWSPQSCCFQWSNPSLGWKIKPNPSAIAKSLGGQINCLLFKLLFKGKEMHCWAQQYQKIQKTKENNCGWILQLLQTVGQIENTLQEVVCDKVHDQALRVNTGFTTRCKHVGEPKKQERFILLFFKTSYGQMRQISTCRRMLERVWEREGTAHDPKQTASSLKHGVIVNMYDWQCPRVYWWFGCW